MPRWLKRCSTPPILPPTPPAPWAEVLVVAAVLGMVLMAVSQETLLSLSLICQANATPLSLGSAAPAAGLAEVPAAEVLLTVWAHSRMRWSRTTHCGDSSLEATMTTTAGVAAVQVAWHWSPVVEDVEKAAVAAAAKDDAAAAAPAAAPAAARLLVRTLLYSCWQLH